jgi:hypothetical protein
MFIVIFIENHPTCKLMVNNNHVTDQLDQRWTSGTSLNVQDPAVGTVRRLSSDFGIILGGQQGNWILASVSAPNVTEGWQVKAVMLRYRIATEVQGQMVAGIFDSIGIRDGELTIHDFTNLNIGLPTGGLDTGWKTHKLELPTPANFQFGLGVSIHAFHHDGLANIFPELFSISSVGLEFIKPGVVGPSPGPV